MDQAKHFVCRSCATPVPLAHKFCGRCGSPVPPEILSARTQFFGQLQAPGKAKLILIRGEGVEGLSYQLNAEQHVVGRFVLGLDQRVEKSVEHLQEIIGPHRGRTSVNPGAAMKIRCAPTRGRNN